MEKLYVGRAFRRRSGGKQETRFVLDVTMGGDVSVRVGRKDCYAVYETVKQDRWLAWVKTAKQVPWQRK